MPGDAAYLAFTHALSPARRAWVQAAGVVLSHTGLSVPLATAVLLVARESEGIQQNVLAEAAGVNRATMTRTIDQAVEAGLLERRAVAGDRRANRICALPAGKVLAKRMEAEIADLRSLVFGEIELADIEAATGVLRAAEARLLRFVREAR